MHGSWVIRRPWDDDVAEEWLKGHEVMLMVSQCGPRK